MKPSLDVSSTPSKTPNPSSNTLNQWLGVINSQPSALTKIACEPRTEETQVKAIVRKAVAQYWPLYQTKFPEAFSDKYGNIRKSLPEVVYLYTPDEMKKFGLTPEKAQAFVCPNDPNKIYMYMPSIIREFQNYGSQEVTATVSHELMHIVTNTTLLENDKQFYRNGDSFNILEKRIMLPAWWHDGQKQSFTVAELLAEGSADTLAYIATGINHDNNQYYKPYRDLTKELIAMDGIGLETYKRALTGLKTYVRHDNNYKAYLKVVIAAGKLADKYNKAYRDTVQSNPFFNWYDQNNREKVK